jgi:hypothetical protein
MNLSTNTVITMVIVTLSMKPYSTSTENGSIGKNKDLKLGTKLEPPTGATPSDGACQTLTLILDSSTTLMNAGVLVLTCSEM